VARGLERRLDERAVAEHAAESDGAVLGVHGHERVHAILGAQFIAPAAFGSRAKQAGAADFADLHSPMA
jgi:hypothetical protein